MLPKTVRHVLSPHNLKPKTFSKVLCIALITSLSTATGQNGVATAQVPAGGAAERVNSSGKLRMLSQRMSAAACSLGADIETERAKTVLSGAIAEYEKILNGLQFGDEDLGMIGEETRGKTILAIENLRSEWEPFKAAALNVVEEEDMEGGIAHISARNLELLKLAVLLVSEVSGEYSNPNEMLQSDAMLVDISGRQRMLSQKIAKEACAIATNNPALGDTEALGKTMGLFETSLIALRDGMDAVGVMPPPTPEIANSLENIWTNWEAVKLELVDLSEAGQAEPAVQSDIVLTLDVILRDMNDTVKMYEVVATNR